MRTPLPAAVGRRRYPSIRQLPGKLFSRWSTAPGRTQMESGPWRCGRNRCPWGKRWRREAGARRCLRSARTNSLSRRRSTSPIKGNRRRVAATAKVSVFVCRLPAHGGSASRPTRFRSTSALAVFPLSSVSDMGLTFETALSELGFRSNGDSDWSKTEQTPGRPRLMWPAERQLRVSGRMPDLRPASSPL